jgi:hypothetical protein
MGVIGLALAFGVPSPAKAQAPYGPSGPGRRVILVQPTTAASALACPAPGPSQLGTFSPDRTLFVGGAIQPTVGATTLGMFGPDVSSILGPQSVFRETAAPIVTYSRGYDGTLVPSMGTSFSSPNLPGLSPVIYPTRANIAPGAGPMLRRPRYWPPATNWIDQN